MTPILTKSYIAEAAVAKRRIVKLGTADGKVLQGAAATDAVFGVSTEIDAAINERCDVHLAGMVEVEAGGTIARGDPITADANGKAVKAAPATGVNNRIVGWADVAAVSGDVFDVLLAQGQIQG